MARDPDYLRNFKAFTSQTGKFRFEDLELLNYELTGSNERAMVVLQVARLEESLESFIKTHLRPGYTKNEMRILFDFSGILGSFGAKITAAYAFNWIGPETRHDLHLIRLLRNGFAHFARPISFSDAPVAAVCEHLKSPKRSDAIHPDVGYLRYEGRLGRYLKSETPIDARTLFETSCFMLSASFLGHGDEYRL